MHALTTLVDTSYIKSIPLCELDKYCLNKILYPIKQDEQYAPIREAMKNTKEDILNNYSQEITINTDYFEKLNYAQIARWERSFYIYYRGKCPYHKSGLAINTFRMCSEEIHLAYCNRNISLKLFNFIKKYINYIYNINTNSLVVGRVIKIDMSAYTSAVNKKIVTV